MLRVLFIISLLDAITGQLPDGFQSYPQDTVVLAGGSVTIECKLKRPEDYSLRVSVQFMKNGTDEILNSRVNQHGHYRLKTSMKTRMLTILKVDEETEGNYRCFGVNIVSDVDIIGPYRKLRIARPPHIEHGNDMIVAESRSLNLSASFTGLPLPNVTLYRNGTMLAFFPNTDQLQYLIQDVTKSDSGLYTIVASNMVKEVKSDFQVTVQYKPRIMTDATPRRHKISSNISFNCDVDSNPRPSFKWLHNNTELSNRPGLYSLLHNGQLIVHNVRYNHTGTFTCVALNGLGEDKKEFKLIVQVPPGPPAQPEVISYSETTVQLRWNEGFDGHSDITGYKLEYQNVSGKWERVVGLKIPRSRDFTVRNLRPNAGYQFRLRALTSVGHSHWSKPSVKIVTQPLAPSRPERLGIDNVTATSFAVFWEPPLGYKENGIHGTLRKYKVEWWVTSEGRSKSSYANVTSNTHSKLITKLKKGTQYTVVVSAINELFIGSASNEQTKTTLMTKPSAPRVKATVVSSKIIRLSWTTPDLGGGSISNIIVEYRKHGGDWKEADQQPRVGDTVVQISGLTETTQYQMRVTLENEKGRSEPGESSRVMTPADEAPMKPKLRVTSVGTNEVEVTWEKTGTNAVLSWNLEYRKDTQNQWEVVGILIHESRKSRVVNTLTPNTTYQFRVAVANNGGQSPYSEVVTVTTKLLEPPPAVSGVNVVEKGDSQQVTMKWERGIEGVTGYLVQYRLASNDEWIENEVEPDITSLVISELQDNSTYFFRVITLRGELRSVPSNISQLTTAAKEGISPLSVGKVSKDSFPLAALIAVCVVGGVVVVVLIVVVIGVYCTRREQNREKWYDPPEDSTSWCQDDSYHRPGSLPPTSSKAISDDIQFETVHYAELQLFEEPVSRPLHMKREDTPYADIDIAETVARAERSRSQSAEPAGPTLTGRRGNIYQLTPQVGNSHRAHPESDV